MGTNDKKCGRCGAYMKQTGAERDTVAYHCSCCGNNEYVTLSAEDNSEYWQKRSILLGRVRKGIEEWETAQWDYIRKDIREFTTSYEAARWDIYFKVAQLACITHGFRNMDSEEYKECKQIFKFTEKIYKRYLKDPNLAHFVTETGNDGMTPYEEYRQLYKKCRSAYRNEKLAWKAVFFVAKKIVPIPKL